MVALLVRMGYEGKVGYDVWMPILVRMVVRMCTILVRMGCQG
jgi:hypothetical protein